MAILRLGILARHFALATHGSDSSTQVSQIVTFTRLRKFAITRTSRTTSVGQKACPHLKTGSQAAPHFPAPACEQQDAIFATAFDIIQKGIAQAAFPAASIAVSCQGKLVALKAFGRFTFETASPPVTIATVFDLASVSKAVATTSMAMILYERGLVDLEAPVVSM